MWVLLILVNAYDGITSSTIDGFKSFESCQEAAIAVKADFKESKRLIQTSTSCVFVK